jgi:acetylornithine deacetylase/succinyl-diaminopimelate desuccinylase-like protein
MTAAMIEAVGGTAELVETDGHPAIVGSIDGDGPRLLRYGMYDVQPTDEPDWTSPPFGAEIRDLPGVGPAVIARGAANSKGCLAAFFLAVQVIRETTDLPVQLALLIDGEEELGSPNLGAVVDAHRSKLAADAAFDMDLTADRSGVPEVYLGCKGILSLRLTASGGDWGGPREKALHSSEGVAVASPAWSLVRALNALVGADESPRIPGLHATQPPPEDLPFVDALVDRFDPKRHLDEAGVSRFKNEGDASSIVNAHLYGAAANINGIRTGYPDGGKTIVPHLAEAVLDLRVPYGLDHETIAAGAKEIVASVAPEVTVEIPEWCPPAKTSADSPVARAMIDSHSDVDRPPLVWPTAPWWAPYFLFEQNLELPFAVGGAGHADGAHASDEYASVEGLREHMKQSVAFLYRYAEASR